MPRVAPIINNFSGGEISPLAQGRTDLDVLRTGVHLLQRYIPTIQGGATKCPGTYYVADAATAWSQGDIDNETYPFLVPFEFSNTQAYIIEFNDQTLRFFKNRALITTDGTAAYSITCPANYSFGVGCQFFQSNDVLYITHPKERPRKLIRRGDTNWALEVVGFEDGPYLPVVSPTTAHPAIVSVGSTATATVLSAPITTITSVGTAGTNYRITTAANHNLVNGELCAIDGVVGSSQIPESLNCSTAVTKLAHTIATVSATQFDVPGFTGTISGVYASSGTVFWAAFGLDNGRLARVKQKATPNEWVWGTLSADTGGHVGQYQLNWAGTNRLTDGTQSEFRLGVWRAGNASTPFLPSYPATAVIYEDRLSFYGAPLDPARLDMSNSSDYENFSPSDPDGQRDDSHAVSFPLASTGVQVGVWLAPDEKGLMAGSEGQEWIVRPSNQSEATTATNFSAKPTDSQGSRGWDGTYSLSGRAIKVGKAALYVQRAGRKLLEYLYYYDVDGFRTEDLTQLAEHITVGGIRQIAFQKSPNPIMWAIRNDGLLIGMTYERGQELKRYSWHRHPIGGYVNAAGSPSCVRSIAVIPSPDGKSEDLWMMVQRYVGTSTVFNIEYMTQPFDSSMDIEDAFFVDAGLTYDNPITISGISSVSTNSVLVSASTHGLADGSRIKISDVVGLSGLNGNDYLTTGSSASTFILQTTGTVNVAYGTLSSSGSNSYISGGYARKYVGTISGLGHLEGEEVDILADGEVVSGVTVVGSVATISGSAVTAHIGYGYDSKIKTLRFDAGAADGTAMSKTQRASQVGLLLDRQGVGLQIGRDFDHLTDVEIPDEELPLLSGIKLEVFEDDYGRDNRICLQHSEPTPSTILAIMPRIVTQDGG